MPTSTLTRTCARPECSTPQVGKSKYCNTHREAARAAWLDKVGAGYAERDARRETNAALFARAQEAGRAAAEATVPVPMIVQEHVNPLDDNSPVKREYAPVMDGVCGFAWVVVRPGNSSFARWLVTEGKGRSSYQGGVRMSVSAYNQSMQRKEAHARAFAAVLVEAGLNAYAQSRMD